MSKRSVDLTASEEALINLLRKSQELNGKDRTHISLFIGSSESATVLGNMARTIEAYEKKHESLAGFFRGYIVYVPDDEYERMRVLRQLSDEIAGMFATPSESTLVWD